MTAAKLWGMVITIGALGHGLALRADDRSLARGFTVGTNQDNPSNGFLAVVVARRAVNITAPRDGFLASVNVSLGESVAEGDTLVTLSDQVLQHELGIGESELKVALGTRNKAAINVDRAIDRVAQTREKPDVFSPNEVKDAEYAVQLARQELQIAESRIEEHQKRIRRLNRFIEQSVVVAPFTGTIAARYLDPGVRLAAHTPIVRLISHNDLLVRFAIPRSVADRMAEGREIMFRSEDGLKHAPCVVTRVAPEIDAALRMVVGEARPKRANSNDDQIQPGMSGFVTIKNDSGGKPAS